MPIPTTKLTRPCFTIISPLPTALRGISTLAPSHPESTLYANSAICRQHPYSFRHKYHSAAEAACYRTSRLGSEPSKRNLRRSSSFAVFAQAGLQAQPHVRHERTGTWTSYQRLPSTSSFCLLLSWSPRTPSTVHSIDRSTSLVGMKRCETYDPKGLTCMDLTYWLPFFDLVSRTLPSTSHVCK